jgi:transposase-like protein
VDCRRTFGEKERPVWVGSHFPKEVWLEYIRLMNMGTTIRAITEALNINPTTAFHWRHKILNARKDGKSDANICKQTRHPPT